MGKHFFNLFELFHSHFNILVFMLFFLLIFLNVLDVHSTYLVISSGSGVELNPYYPEVNQGEYGRAIRDKVIDIFTMLISLIIFVLSIDSIIYLNDTHGHFLDHAIHHFTWFLKYFVVLVLGFVNFSYFFIVINNYFIYLI